MWYPSADWALSRRSSKIFINLEDNEDKLPEENRIVSPSYLLEHYIKNGSIHGLRYIFDTELYNIERFVWFIFVIISIAFTAKTICTVSADFQVNRYKTFVFFKLIFISVFCKCYIRLHICHLDIIQRLCYCYILTVNQIYTVDFF